MKKNTKANNNKKSGGQSEKPIAVKKGNFTFDGTEKKKKASKKGKKNWRKNIDVSEYDKQNIKKLDQNIAETNAKLMKDEDLFTLDVKPIESAKQRLLREKTEKKKKVKKISKYEERKLKKMIKNKIKSEKTTNQQNNSHSNKSNANESSALHEKLAQFLPAQKKNEDVYDLWGNNSNDQDYKIIFKFPNSSLNQNKSVLYPKIPLPHPGQSYNPSQKDVKSLIEKVVEVNKHLITKKIQEKEPKKEIQHVKLYNSSDSENESEDDNKEKDFKVSNNPPVDDTERKTKKERKRLIQKKINILKEKEIKKTKEMKKEISNAIGIKKFEKQKNKFLKEREEKKMKEEYEKREKEKLIRLGLVEE